MLKSLYLLPLLVLSLASIAQKLKPTKSPITAIKLEAWGEGGQRICDFSEDSIVVYLFINYRKKPVKKHLWLQPTAQQWRAITSIADSLDLPQLHTYVSPTNEREVDGAMYNQIFITANGVTYKSQNLDKMKACFSKDLEWYQDNGGLILYDQVFENFENILARPEKITRQLTKGSIEVYPIKNYGAIQTGEHLFCHKENGKDDCGTFKFMMLWQKKDGDWKITRVISYNH